MIPFTDYGGAGLPLVFLHANGYPPGCYQPLIRKLAGQYRVRAMHMRPLWPGSQPAELRDWGLLSDDLLRFFDEQKLVNPIVVGHSMGGITALRAALRQPDRFRALALIDPVLFPPNFILGWNILRMLGLAHRTHPLIDAAKNRRREFDDLERLFKGYRRKSTFRYMDDEALRAYIAGIACQNGPGQFKLCYSPEWEVQVYYSGIWRDLDLWRNLRRLAPPTLIVRGAETDTFYESTGQRVRKINPQVQVETLERATHLVPLEHPHKVFEKIDAFLKEKV